MIDRDYYDKVDNLKINGKETSYFYMGVLEHHIPQIALKRKDEMRPEYYETDSYFNRNLSKYKQPKEVCQECQFNKGCSEKRKDILKREYCSEPITIENQIVQYLFYYSEKLHSVIVYENWADWYKDDLGAETIVGLQNCFESSMKDIIKIHRKELDEKEQKKIFKSFQEEIKKKNVLITIVDYETKLIKEYTNYTVKDITDIEITNIFDILKLI